MADPTGRGAPGWRWPVACVLFLAGVVSLLAGVSLSERPDIVTAGVLAKAYYSLGLFVFGGLDLGTPSGGPLPARMLLWLTYFGAPALTASAVIEALLRAMAPQRWQLRRLKDHVLVVGTGDLTISYLRVLRRHNPDVPVVVVGREAEALRVQELEATFDVVVILGDITHNFLLHQLGLKRARRVVLLDEDAFEGYEAATKILRQCPELAGRIILHCKNLRFLRAMQNTGVARQLTGFNCYHLAATGLVRDQLIIHFKKTSSRDTVVIAGFGRFGQTIMEELQRHAENEIDTVAIIDVDAQRRLLVAQEQQPIDRFCQRLVVEGDIAHPEVWRELQESVDLSRGEPVFILGTGRTDENLRVALWIKGTYPSSLVFTRTSDFSEFAQNVGVEHGIESISITQLVEDNIPLDWVK